MSAPKPTTPNINWNVDQLQAIKDARPNSKTFHLFYGGGGSGKSFLIMYIILVRAMTVPNSRHGIFRLTRNACEDKLFKKTLQEVLAVWPGLNSTKYCEISKSSMTITFTNGSIVAFDGLDENRMDKVLGDEFHTIWINECNEPGLTYKQVSQLIGRLRSPPPMPNGKPLKLKMFFDCNPQWKSDWEYRAFIAGVNPIDGNAMDKAEEWTANKLNPHANLERLGPDYIKNMSAAMTAADRRRFIDGDWADNNPDALFKEEMFAATRIPLPKNRLGLDMTPTETLKHLAKIGVELTRTTVNADPAVTNDVKSDSTGIVVTGLGRDKHVYILADYTMKGDPDAVCKTISKAYKDWGCNKLIMEKNQGGLWLEATMRKHFANVPLEFVSATATTGGKSSRAEPVSVQYKEKLVHHVGPFGDLEAQMCDWGSPNSRKKSPDRMDALVWGVTWLLDLQGPKRLKKGGYIARKGDR